MKISKYDIDEILNLIKLSLDDHTKIDIEKKIDNIGNDFRIFEDIEIDAEIMNSPTQFINKHKGKTFDKVDFGTKAEDLIANSSNSKNRFIVVKQVIKNE